MPSGQQRRGQGQRGQQERDTWDVVVLGGGPAGENAADYAVRGTDRTAVIVESELVGGECSYWACMPSKALLRSVQVAEVARGLPGLAGRLSKRGLDVGAVLGRRDTFTSHLDDSGQVRWANGAGIDVLRGTARLAGPRTVEVTDAEGSTRTVTAREAVVLATGTRATVPDVPGLAEALPWTSRDVTNLHQVPKRVVVLGGGVVACEAATWLLGLGVEELTLVERGDHLLGRAEPFAGELVREALEARGARVLLGREVTRVTRESPRDKGIGHIAGGPVTVHLGRRGSVTADEVVVATGRTPNTADLGLEAVGLADAVAGNRGYVPVDDRLQVQGVTGQWLYAVGDVNGRALLTHMGKYQGRIAGAVIAARARGERAVGREYRDVASARAVPSVTFTSPEVASVGLTEAAARDAGVDVETVEYDLAAVAGASLLRDDYTGRAKLVVDRATDLLVGATFVGEGSAELLHSATVAIVGKVTLADLWHAVPSYPTVSEVWLRLLETRRTAS
ncbi:dihydrolipoyl dehydrogenase family protein [Lapillicoccus jejuensis]|uniref:Dihydrolipoamide dehydrogenase n=1 Tax=Lapillicoccus jejuensis TaxID=402171 RepID=A0A542E6A5_9MICO|nr:NAD(P)/FAD-dependent oxidoreductase [Lapillicoccus jejuensis]TQJ10819.1 dihydrolipoamide dehydrogenase [Lapillicoccus jejuensis]